MSNTDKSLAKALGMEPIAEVIPPAPPEVQVDTGLPDQESDYQLSRNTFRELIRKGNLAMDDMQKLASEAESPRAYEVYATMMKTIADVTKDLYELQKKTKELKEVKGKPTQPDGAINVEKAVFVGTTADLLKQIKEQQK